MAGVLNAAAKQQQQLSHGTGAQAAEQQQQLQHWSNKGGASSSMGNNRVKLVIGVACACSFFYVLFLVLFSSSHPCFFWHKSCPTSSSSSFNACSKLAKTPTQKTKLKTSATTTATELLHLVNRMDSALMALNDIPGGEGAATAPNSIDLVGPGFKTDLSRIVFGIAAAADMWGARKEYVRLWWKPEQKMRGFVWFDKKPSMKWSSDLPPYRVSENTARFKYTYKRGWRSAIRISRIVSESFRLGLPDVDWFVMGDDDTLFFPDNLVQVLSKYNHSKMFYIGNPSESHLQNILFSYNMAYGGGGFAISYPLATALAKMQDACLERYPHLFGSDDRMHACMAEIGILLTKEPGFHQLDIHGDASGLLSAHPVAPLVSLHHLDLISPIFPNTQTINYTRMGALKHLMMATEIDPGSILQQSICYDKRHHWSFSVSWGYSVQVHKGFITPRELEIPIKTFTSWHRETSKVEFPFNTRDNPDDLCSRPMRFFMESVKAPTADSGGLMQGIYVRENNGHADKCGEKLLPLSVVEKIHIKRELTDDSWYQLPRRSCCRIRRWESDKIEVHVGACQDGEILIV